MISEAIEPRRWPATRWWTLIGSVLAGQVWLIFWLGKPHPDAPPPRGTAPQMELANSSAAQVLAQTDPGLLALLQRQGFSGSPDSGRACVLALRDPTLFALPHQEGFSGPAWLNAISPDFQSLVWSQTPRWLELGQGWVGSELRQFMATNQFDALRSLEQQELALKLPAHEQAELPPAQSRLRLAGGLSGRRLLGAPDLPSWPSGEMLTNSIVQLVVAADGAPVRPPCSRPGALRMRPMIMLCDKRANCGSNRSTWPTRLTPAPV